MVTKYEKIVEVPHYCSECRSVIGSHQNLVNRKTRNVQIIGNLEKCAVMCDECSIKTSIACKKERLNQIMSDIEEDDTSYNEELLAIYQYLFEHADTSTEKDTYRNLICNLQ